MGTHNLFLRLGDSVFLEVIACNPDAENPERTRWFALDNMTKDTPPQLKAWVVRTENIHAVVENLAEPLGEIEPMSRGDNNWLITIPQDGSLPVDGGAPALIQWKMTEHPAIALKDFGLSLSKLEICHPKPEILKNLLKTMNLKENIEVIKADETKLTAYIDTPNGLRVLNS